MSQYPTEAPSYYSYPALQQESLGTNMSQYPTEAPSYLTLAAGIAQPLGKDMTLDFLTLGTIAAPFLFAYTAVSTSNQAACSTQSFFITLGMFIGPLNNCALCIYYIWVVKLNMSVVKIKKKVEPFLYAIPWMIAIIIPSIAVATRSINPWHSMCLITPYRPEGCESDDCVTGKDSVRTLDLIQSVLLIIVFIAIIVMMTVAQQFNGITTHARNRKGFEVRGFLSNPINHRSPYPSRVIHMEQT